MKAVFYKPFGSKEGPVSALALELMLQNQCSRIKLSSGETPEDLMDSLVS